MKFDSPNDGVQCNYLEILNKYNNHSVSIWINANSYTNCGTILQNSNGSSDIRQGIQVSKHPFFDYTIVSAGYFEAGYYGCGGELKLKEWTHILYTQLNGIITLYVNGIKMNDYKGLILDYTDGLFFGCRADGIYSFDGCLQNLRIYNKVLTSGVISKLHRLKL